MVCLLMDEESKPEINSLSLSACTSISRGVKQGSKRGLYKRSALETRMCVLSAAERGEDWESVAAEHGVKKITAYNWVRRDRASHLQRGGVREKVKKIESKHIESLVEWLNECPQLTLKNLCERLHSTYGLTVSQQTIACHLDGRMISLKQVHLQPEAANNLRNKLLRKEYVESVMKCSGEGKFNIYIGESNVSLFFRRSKGKSIKGTRTVVHLPYSKGPNIQMIGALCQTGFIDFLRRRGSYRSDSCNEWMRKLMEKVITIGTPSDQIVVVADNAPSHAKLESIVKEFQGATFLRLAPYSPMLNPIEGAWSVIKALLKQKEADQLSELLAGDPENILSKSEWKLHFVEKLIDESVAAITPAMCLNFVNHTHLFFGRSLQKEDVPVGQ